MQHLQKFLERLPWGDPKGMKYQNKKINTILQWNFEDFNFFGHQLATHLVTVKENDSSTNPVDGEDIPARHFGIILNMSNWEELVQNLKKKGIQYLIQPQIRFKVKTGEQSTFFILDPFGNALEFKAFADKRQLFAN